MALLTAPKAIIFDWDNTLVNTWPLIHKALHQTFVKHGVTPWTLEETKARVAHSLRDSFPVLFGERWEEAGRDYQSFYRSTHLNELEALPLSEDVLKFLNGQGVYLAIVSNKKGESLRAEAKAIGWDKYFSKMVGSLDAARDKPYPDPVYMALEGSGIAPGEDVWFVGDTAVDLECAKATHCVPVLYGELGDEKFISVGETRQFNGFELHFHAPTHAVFLQLLREVFIHLLNRQ